MYYCEGPNCSPPKHVPASVYAHLSKHKGYLVICEKCFSKREWSTIAVAKYGNVTYHAVRIRREQ